MDDSRLNSSLVFLRRFGSYFTTILVIAFVIRSTVETTIISYVNLTLPVAFVLSLWMVYLAGRSVADPNSATASAVRIGGAILLVAAILLEYLDFIGNALNRVLVAYVFLAVLGLCSVGILTCEDAESGDETRREPLSELLRRTVSHLSTRETVCLAGVLVLAAALRLHELSTHSLVADETIHMAAVKGIHSSLLPVLPSGLMYLRGFVYTYSASASTLVFGMNEFGLRFPSVVFGVALVVVGFVAGAVLFDRRTGLITSLLVAIDPFLIGFSRVGRFYILFYLCATAAIVLFYTSFVQNRTGRWAFGFVGILTVVTHELSVFLFPVFFLWWAKDTDFDARKKFPRTDFAFLSAPVVVYLLFREVRNYSYRMTMPGTPISETTKSILGLNRYNIHFYWEVLVHPYAVFVLLSIPIILYALYRAGTRRYPYKTSYISSFVCGYLVLLGYTAVLNNLRFIVLVVPLLLLLFAHLLSYLVEGLRVIVGESEAQSVSVTPKTGILTPAVIGVLVTLNLFVGGLVTDVGYELREIPEETESNWKMMEQHLRGNEYAFQSKVTHYLFMNTRDAAAYVRERSSEDAIVISTSNYGPVETHVPADYNSNYQMSRYLGYNSSGTRYDQYRGTPIITDAAMAEAIFESGRPVWIIADVRFEDYTREEVEVIVKNNSRLVYTSTVSNSSRSTNLFGERSEVRVYYSPETNRSGAHREKPQFQSSQNSYAEESRSEFLDFRKECC